jgi:hypothetical protein
MYNIAGQRIFVISPVSDGIDVSTLQRGMYIVEVSVEGRKVRQKLLVQ